MMIYVVIWVAEPEQTKHSNNICWVGLLFFSYSIYLAIKFSQSKLILFIWCLFFDILLHSNFANLHTHIVNATLFIFFLLLQCIPYYICSISFYYPYFPGGVNFVPRQGGYLIPPFGNQGRSCFRPHVAIHKL